MYSPKIDELLIPIIYTKSKEAKKPMTKIVNEILRDKLIEKREEVPKSDIPETKAQTV
jgi:hypothetical protein